MYKFTAITRVSCLSLLLACATVALGCDDKSVGDTKKDGATMTTGAGGATTTTGAGGATGSFGTGGATGQADASGTGGTTGGSGGTSGGFWPPDSGPETNAPPVFPGA